MPREQETSLPHDPATSDDPLFREPSGQYRDGTAAGDRDGTATGETPIGDELSAGRHTTARDGEPLPGDTVTDAPGEWVAGNKGPGYASADDAVDTTESTDTTGATGTADDLRTTRDPAVAPDSALATEPETVPGAEPTRAGTTEPTRADTIEPTRADTTVPPADATTPPSSGATTPADTTPADTTHNGTAPATTGTPVPGAPGTAETTGVDVAAAAFVTNGDELHADWARIQSSFVDDPRQSVSQAADLVGQVTRSLVTAVQEREQTLRGSWENQDGTDTEHLRNALRDYRAFFELLVKL